MRIFLPVIKGPLIFNIRYTFHYALVSFDGVCYIDINNDPAMSSQYVYKENLFLKKETVLKHSVCFR